FGFCRHHRPSGPPSVHVETLGEDAGAGLPALAELPRTPLDKVLETLAGVYPHEGHALITRRRLDLLFERLEIILVTNDEEDVHHRCLREGDRRRHDPGLLLDEGLEDSVLDQRVNVL